MDAPLTTTVIHHAQDDDNDDKNRPSGPAVTPNPLYKLHDSVALGNFEQGLLRNRLL